MCSSQTRASDSATSQITESRSEQLARRPTSGGQHGQPAHVHSQRRPASDLLVVGVSGRGGSALAGHAAGAATAVGRVLREVDVSLAVGAHKEGRHVDQLLTDAHVALADQGAGVVDGLGHAGAEDQGLQPAFQQLLGGQLQHEVEALLVLREQLVAEHAAQQCLALEHALGVLLVKSQQGTRGLTELGQGELDAPDLALAAQTVLAAELQLLVEALLLEGTTRGGRRGAVVTVAGDLGHVDRP
mmetsp:Transcript_7582/g.11354  ORF Transcript_7582/g.11354 Transcript_7582/m.11354 type:complete len:244 (-) Transcript_7582:44-775(-)